jgi:hypothetical protein
MKPICDDLGKQGAGKTKTLNTSQKLFWVWIFSPTTQKEPLFLLFFLENESISKVTTQHLEGEYRKKKHKHTQTPKIKMYYQNGRQMHKLDNLSKSPELMIIFKKMLTYFFLNYWRNNMFFMCFLFRSTFFAFWRSGITSIFWICCFWTY